MDHLLSVELRYLDGVRYSKRQPRGRDSMEQKAQQRTQVPKVKLGTQGLEVGLEKKHHRVGMHHCVVPPTHGASDSSCASAL